MREFTWCRQELAEFCTSPEEHVHVCITTPDYRLITPRCGRPHINLRFHDLEPAELPPNTPVERLNACFSKQQAQEIIEFVNKTDKPVVVNCEAGISRSPGVVLGFRRFFGGDIQECFSKAHPNLHVASLLELVLNDTHAK